jgi:hypothetical protein
MLATTTMIGRADAAAASASAAVPEEERHAPHLTAVAASKVTSALAHWLEGAIHQLHSDVRQSPSASTSSSHPKILHLTDPGYADEDLDGYDFYSYEFQRLNRVDIDDDADREGVATTTTTPSRSFVVDVPSTGTCVEDGTCALPTLEDDDDEAEDVAVDAVAEVTHDHDDDDYSFASTQEASYVEHASSPGDDRQATLSGAAVLPTEAPVPEYSAADWAAGADFGVPQTVPDDANVRDRIVVARRYMREHVRDANNPTFDKVRDICLNKHESCAFWASLGECEANPAYMLVRTLRSDRPRRPSLPRICPP